MGNDAQRGSRCQFRSSCGYSRQRIQRWLPGRSCWRPATSPPVATTETGPLPPSSAGPPAPSPLWATPGMRRATMTTGPARRPPTSAASAPRPLRPRRGGRPVRPRAPLRALRPAGPQRTARSGLRHPPVHGRHGGRQPLRIPRISPAQQPGPQRDRLRRPQPHADRRRLRLGLPPRRRPVVPGQRPRDLPRSPRVSHPGPPAPIRPRADRPVRPLRPGGPRRGRRRRPPARRPP